MKAITRPVQLERSLADERVERADHNVLDIVAMGNAVDDVAYEVEESITRLGVEGWWERAA